jgi:N-alpha-acetyl-L-2,4-diaminobutyrate deacetylase
MKAFGAPVGLILQELDSEGMLDIAAERRGKVFLTTELGGSARVGVQPLAVAERGVRNVLRHFEVIDGEIEPVPEGRTRLMDVRDQSHFVRATADGIYVPHHEIGGWVEEGGVVGEVVFIADPTREPQVLHARTAGMVWGQRSMARVERGDAVAVLADDLDPSDFEFT